MPIEGRVRWSLLVVISLVLFSFIIILGEYLYSRKTVRLFEGRFTKKDASSAISLWQSRNLSSARDQLGTWVANLWIPPHPWRTYSIPELQDFYRSRSIVWLGDSTARRAALTMYEILNKSKGQHIPQSILNAARTIDVNKGSVTEPCSIRAFNHTSFRFGTDLYRICRRIEHTNATLLYQRFPCFGDLNAVLDAELQGESTYIGFSDLLVVALGAWDVLGRCRQVSNQQSFAQLVNKTVTKLVSIAARGTTIVVRTSGYIDNGRSKETLRLRNITTHYNKILMDRMDELFLDDTLMYQTNLFYVNWGEAMEPRSFLPQRIVGDLGAHFGAEARIVLLWMITNVLQQYENDTGASRRVVLT